MGKYIRKIVLRKYFPVFARVRIQAPHAAACIRAKINSPRFFSCMYWFCAGGQIVLSSRQFLRLRKPLKYSVFEASKLVSTKTLLLRHCYRCQGNCPSNLPWKSTLWRYFAFLSRDNTEMLRKGFADRGGWCEEVLVLPEFQSSVPPYHSRLLHYQKHMD